MLAIFATLFGSAASLGLGALQIRSGLQIVTGIGGTGNTVLIVIIAILTIAFVLSAVPGIARGIQWLSNINMVLAITLAMFVFVVGPTIFILNVLPTSIGSYLADLPMMSARTGAEGSDVDTWLQSWTIFYWAWWVSWTPFVGMFIARISRGAPSGSSSQAFCWFRAWCRWCGSRSSGGGNQRPAGRCRPRR